MGIKVNCNIKNSIQNKSFFQKSETNSFKRLFFLILFFLICLSSYSYADITIGLGLNVNVGSSTPTSSPTPSLGVPVFVSIPSVATGPQVLISGTVDEKTTKVKLLLNNQEISTIDAVNKSFTFSNVFLTSANNQISAIAMDNSSSTSDPATATILFPSFTKLYKNIDLFDYSISDWGNWGYISSIFQSSEGNKNILVVNQDFNFKPTTEDNWGGILWKTVADWQKDFSAFKKLTYRIKNDGTHPQVTVKLALYEASGELWQEKTAHTLSDNWQDITTYLNEATFQLIEDQWNRKVNGRLDLNNIAKVAIFIAKNNASGTHTLSLANITANDSDLLPPTVASSEVNTSQNNYVLSGTMPSGATSIKILADTQIVTNINYLSNNRWNAVISSLAQGVNNLEVFALDQNSNESEPVACKISFDNIRPNKPLLLISSGIINVNKITVNGTLNDTDIASVELYINNSKISSIAPVTSSGNYTFSFNANLTPPENIIEVKAIDKAGNISDFSDKVTLKLAPKEYAFSIAGTNYPLKIVVPVGAVQMTDDPMITIYQPNPDVVVPPAMLSNLPKGRVLHDNQAQIIDINLPEIIKVPVTISIPVENYQYVEPWYYNPITQTWTQDGIQSWKIDTIANDVVVGGQVVSLKQYYLTFTVSHLSVFGIFEKKDLVAPKVADIKFANKSIEEGDYIKANSLLTLSLADNRLNDSGITSCNVSAIDADTSEVKKVLKTQVFTTPVGEYQISVSNINLESDRGYKLKVDVADAANNVSSNITAKFNVTSKFSINDCLNGPNPFNPNKEVTKIQYQLTQDADVKICIYTISGEQVFKGDYKSGSEGGMVGFNSIAWDGRDKFNEIVANGVYIAYLIAKSSGGDVEVGKVKIAVLK